MRSDFKCEDVFRLRGKDAASSSPKAPVTMAKRARERAGGKRGLHGAQEYSGTAIYAPNTAPTTKQRGQNYKSV